MCLQLEKFSLRIVQNNKVELFILLNAETFVLYTWCSLIVFIFFTHFHTSQKYICTQLSIRTDFSFPLIVIFI